MSRNVAQRRRAHGRRIRQWSRLPVVHFLLIGGLLYAAQVWVSGSRLATPDPDSPAPVVFAAAQIERLARAWQRRTGRLPGAEEQRALIRQAIEYYLEDLEDLRLALERLQDPADPLLDWEDVRRDLLKHVHDFESLLQIPQSRHVFDGGFQIQCRRGYLKAGLFVLPG